MFMYMHLSLICIFIFSISEYVYSTQNISNILKVTKGFAIYQTLVFIISKMQETSLKRQDREIEGEPLHGFLFQSMSFSVNMT